MSDAGPDKESCGVTETEFPLTEVCCRRRDCFNGLNYEKICPYCIVWVSPPDSLTLEITAIIECPRLGYGKRIREQSVNSQEQSETERKT